MNTTTGVSILLINLTLLPVKVGLLRRVVFGHLSLVGCDLLSVDVTNWSSWGIGRGGGRCSHLLRRDSFFLNNGTANRTANGIDRSRIDRSGIAVPGRTGTGGAGHGGIGGSDGGPSGEGSTTILTFGVGVAVLWEVDVGGRGQTGREKDNSVLHCEVRVNAQMLE